MPHSPANPVDPWRLMAASLAGEPMLELPAPPGHVHLAADDDAEADVDTLAELQDLLGQAPLRALIEHYGGTSFVPRARMPVLQRALGPTAAAALAERFGPAPVQVPSLACWRRRCRDADIRDRAAAGETHRAIALVLGITERQVQRVLQAHRRSINPPETRLQTPPTITVRALSNIHRGERIYRAGELIADLAPREAEQLLTGGSAQLASDPPPRPVALPPRPWTVADPRDSDAITLSAWLGLAEQSRKRRHGVDAPLPDERAQTLAEAWRAMDRDQQRDAYTSRYYLERENRHLAEEQHAGRYSSSPYAWSNAA